MEKNYQGIEDSWPNLEFVTNALSIHSHNGSGRQTFPWRTVPDV